MDAENTITKAIFMCALVLLNSGADELSDFERAACERVVVAYRAGNRTASSWDVETMLNALAAIYL